MQNRTIYFYDLGIIDYSQAWDFQKEIFEKTLVVKSNNRDNLDIEPSITTNSLIFCEHPHVFTLGKSGKIENLLASESFLKTKGASFVETSRGGDITYHGPGQLVVYPILDLDNFFTDIHKYMRSLEEVVIRVCEDFGVKATREHGLTGVWISDLVNSSRKICAMGVKTSMWVTMHGLALNVSVNLDYFNLIVPCGISNKAVTSLNLETDVDVTMTLVKESLLKHFVEVFGISKVEKI